MVFPPKYAFPVVVAPPDTVRPPVCVPLPMVEEAVTRIPSPYNGTCVPTCILSQGTVAADAKDIKSNVAIAAKKL